MVGKRGRPKKIKEVEEVKPKRPRGRPKKELEEGEKPKTESKLSDIPYCGIRKPAEGRKIGNMRECAEQNKVYLYGLKQIDPAIIVDVERTKKKQKGEVEVAKKRAFISGRIKNLKSLIKHKEGDEEDIKKAEKEIIKLKKELKELNAILLSIIKGKKKYK